MVSVAAGSDERLFTGMTGCAAATDFVTTSTVIDFGSLYIRRTRYNILTGSNAGIWGSGSNIAIVLDEEGEPFSFNANDDINIILSTESDWNGYSPYLVYGPTSSCSTGTSISTVQANTAGVNGNGDPTITIHVDPTIPIATMESGFRLCASTTYATVISTTDWINADLLITYFDPRYVESNGFAPYGPVYRNGCSVTLFNVPSPEHGDKAFIRLTNISDVTGEVTATIWTEAGVAIDADSVISATPLVGHATAVFSSDSTHSGYLGASMPTYATLTKADGRSRIIVKGAFPACEALGLIRTPIGVLTNMTSTTYSGDFGAWGGTFRDQPANGTSNTQN
jgi:hypothetical protein